MLNGGVIGKANSPTTSVASGVWTLDELFAARDLDIWPGIAGSFAMELVTPTSIAFSGTSASIVGSGSVDFAAVTSLSLNGVFSADYDNYVISYIGQTPSTGGPPLVMRMRSGTTDSTTGYTWQFIFANDTSVTGSRNSTEGFARGGMVDTLQRSGSHIAVYGPALAQPTAFRSTSSSGFQNATLIDYASTHSVSTAYDGTTMFVTGTNMTGSVAVYGLRG